MLFTLIVLLTSVLIVTTILPLSRSTRWWIRDLDFPRVQIVGFGIGLFGTQAAFLDFSSVVDYALMTVTAGCILYQGWWILPYTCLYAHEVELFTNQKAGERIRILAANVLQQNRDATALVSLIHEHQPDIFVTLESNVWWQSQLDTLEKDYPYSIKCALENLYGMHVYSKLILESSETQFLVQDDIPSMYAMAHLPSGRKVHVHFLHPMPPSPTENDVSTERDAELLIVAERVARSDGPVIVAGDLNDVAWSTTTRLFRKISRLLDPRVGRGMFNTFHADYWFMRWPLDHLFHSTHFTLSFIKRLPAFGSDHFPVLVELVYDTDNGIWQKGLEATASDELMAQEKIAEGQVQKSESGFVSFSSTP